MVGWLFILLRAAARSRLHLMAENLALRQQLASLRARGAAPQIRWHDRVLWVVLSRYWARWREALCFVSPGTVVRWHRAGFRKLWAWRSRHRRPGRPGVDPSLRSLIRQMALENGWGAPRIHGELLKLGFQVSERTVSRYMPRQPARPDAVQRWRAFLKNHAEGIAAMDFFTVPTATFKLLYAIVIIHHGTRRILQFNATFHPTARWIVQQLREAFPYDTAPRYLVFDRDAKFGHDVLDAIRSLGIKPVRTAYRSPWHNPFCERWIGSCRRELLDHVIVFGARHLVRLVRRYVAYYHEDRTHLGLGKETPAGRPVTPNPSPSARVVALPRVGGIHHRYIWREAA